MIRAEIHTEFVDGNKEVIRKEFRNKYDMYKDVIVEFLDMYLESAREDLEDNEFMALCLQISGFMAEYFT